MAAPPSDHPWRRACLSPAMTAWSAPPARAPRQGPPSGTLASVAAKSGVELGLLARYLGDEGVAQRLRKRGGTRAWRCTVRYRPRRDPDLPVPLRFSRLKIVCGSLGSVPGAGTFDGGVGVGWLFGFGVAIAYEVSAAASANPAVSTTSDPRESASHRTRRLTVSAFSWRRSSSASARARSIIGCSRIWRFQSSR